MYEALRVTHASKLQLRAFISTDSYRSSYAEGLKFTMMNNVTYIFIYTRIYMNVSRVCSAYVY